jgi:hypothetical protein
LATEALKFANEWQLLLLEEVIEEYLENNLNADEVMLVYDTFKFIGNKRGQSSCLKVRFYVMKIKFVLKFFVSSAHSKLRHRSSEIQDLVGRFL